MPAKGSYCEMCSHRGKKADMILNDGHYFCSIECRRWFHDVYNSDKEVKADDEKGLANHKS